MRDLSTYVVRKYAIDWYDIGLQLGLEAYKLDIIEEDHHQQCVTCFRQTLREWLNTGNATWKMLEVALTNVNKVKFVSGKDVLVNMAQY